MIFIAVLLAALLWASAHGLRTVGRGPRWPFGAALVLSGGALLGLGIATLIALTAGRDTWNGWVTGSQASETFTLWLVLVVGPALVATCCVLLIIGTVLRTRHGRSQRTTTR